MQHNRKDGNDMDTQKTLEKQAKINRCYVVWNHYNKETGTEEPKIILFRRPHNIKPFHEQTPMEVLTEKQLKERHGVKLR